MRRMRVSSMKKVEIADWMKTWKREQKAERNKSKMVKG